MKKLLLSLIPLILLATGCSTVIHGTPETTVTTKTVIVEVSTTTVFVTLPPITVTPIITTPAATLTSILVTPSTPQKVNIGLTMRFTATGVYSNGSTSKIDGSTIDASGAHCVWNSSNPSVALFQLSTGELLQSAGPGITNITVSFEGITSNSVLVTVPVPGD